MPRKPSPATVIGLLALFFALGGSALAAKHYLITSTKQIKPSVLRQLHGRTGATGQTGAGGAAGPQGAQGAQGPEGPSNLSGLTTIIGPTVSVATGKAGGAEAICPEGMHAVSGGGYGSIAGIAISEMESTHQSWFIIIANQTGITVSIHATAECAGEGQAVAASVRRPTHVRFNLRMAQLKREQAEAGF